MDRPTRREPSAERPASSRAPSAQPTGRRPLLLRLAGWLLLFAALAAPWIGGTQTTVPDARWWLGGALAGAFLLGLIGRLLTRRGLSLHPAAVVAVLFLLGCLAWWATQAEPNFATAFAAEHWAFLQRNSPLGIFQWARAERLGFFACLLLGFVAAAELGSRESFRQRLTLVIGLSGFGVAIYAAGFAWGGWPALPWTLIGDGPERLNVCFNHYSGPPACLNLAWPLLVFGVKGGRHWLGWGARLVVLAVIGGALLLWPSAAGQAIAVGLFLAGAIWRAAERRGWFTPNLICGTIAAVFLAVFACQWLLVARMQATQPDGWLSAEATQLNAPARDASLRAAAERRGDRLVLSTAPDRPSAWLSGARMAADYPWLGAGPGAWVKLSGLYTHDATVSTFYHYRQYAHHDLLQMAAEWGGLAAMAAVLLWAGAFWQAAHRDPAQSAGEAGIILALLGVALHSTVDFVLQNPAIQIWTALLLGLAWSSVRAKSVRNPPAAV